MSFKTVTVYTCDNCRSESGPIEQVSPDLRDYRLDGVDPNPPGWFIGGNKPDHTFKVGGWVFSGTLCEGCVTAVNQAGEDAFNARRHPSMAPISSYVHGDMETAYPTAHARRAH